MEVEGEGTGEMEDIEDVHRIGGGVECASQSVRKPYEKVGRRGEMDRFAIFNFLLQESNDMLTVSPHSECLKIAQSHCSLSERANSHQVFP
jgi:hypothetical protein